MAAVSKRIFVFGLAAVGLFVCLRAQDAGGSTAAGAPGLQQVGVEGPIMSEDYVLMPGDRLLVTVTGSVTYSYETWVTYDGKITINLSVPFSSVDGGRSSRPATEIVDAVRISGLTMESAADTLTVALARYFRDVEAKLTLLGLRSGIVFVTGEVKSPGAYSASPVERVSQVIARAGGLSPLGSRSRINIIRGGRLHSIADIGRFEREGNLDANPFVESGDVVFVPPVDGMATVKGAVFGRGEYRLRTSALTTEKERISEGTYELEPGDRVFDLVRKAGGITPWADPANAYVERLVMGGHGTRKKMSVDVHAIMFEFDTSQNIVMMNADVLVIPPINTLVYVEGEVNGPGAFLHTPNLTAGDYIGQAGGPTHYANMNVAYVLRAGERIPARADPVVEPGDRIMIPRNGIKWWQDYLQIFSGIGLPVASIIISVYALRNN